MNELGRLAAAGQTAAHFAHEVGTPLNLISGHVQLLKSDLERDPRDAETRNQDNKRSKSSASNESFAGCSTKPDLKQSFPPLDLTGLLRRLCDAMSPALDKRRISLVDNLADNLPLIAGSADRLQQLFLNLINNSLDAMPDAGSCALALA